MDVKTNYLAQVIGENPEALLAIREIPHFRNCSDELLALVYEYGRVFSLKHNEELTRENEFDQWVFFVLSGRLAVTVGDELVDTIASSLVGERCLLGEPRKATLRATEEGIVALGVDMAVLDAMQRGDGENREKEAILIELLSIIVAEIVNRVAFLSHNQIDTSYKFQAIRETENVSAVIQKLVENRFQDDLRANIEIYKFLHRSGRGLLSACLADDGFTVDTRRLYANCVNTGRYDLISDLAAALQQTLNAGGSGRETGEHFFQGRHFKDFSEQVRQAVGQRLAGDGSGPPRNPLTETLWSRNFRVNEELTVEIPQLSRWLARAYGLTGPEIIDVLMIILKEASEFTAAINGSIKDLVRQMNETTLLAKLQDAAANPESQLLEFITTGTSEELIPLFSKHVLDVHLIKPYLEALARDAESAPASGPAETTPAAEPAESAAPAGAGQSVANSLFD